MTSVRGTLVPGVLPLLTVSLTVLLVLWVPGCLKRQTLVVTATAYNSHPSQTDSLSTLAAWGDELRPGMQIVAVSPDLVEMGLTHRTVVWIEGLPGPYQVLDRMPGRFQRRIDIYMGDDVEQAREWGRRKVEITW